jgi:TldD protein
MSDAALGFFRDRFGLDDRLLAAALDLALARPVDHADLYFEHTTRDSVSLEEGIVKTGSRHVEQGLGVRAVAGERQGYAHADDVALESLEHAASTARAIAEGQGARRVVAVGAPRRSSELYPVAQPAPDVPVPRKVELLERIDAWARARDPRVVQVLASVSGEHKHVMIAASDGTWVGDLQPLVRLNVQVVAQQGRRRETGSQGMGGRFELEILLDPAHWQPLVDAAVRQPSSVRPARWTWCSARAGPASCSTRRSATGSRATSTARARPPSRAGSASASPRAASR